MRVVVTGMGAIAPNGNTVPEYWNSLISAKSGIDHISYFDTSNFPVKIAGEISNFDPENYFERKEVRKLDPFSIYALVACSEAIEMSGLNSYDFNCMPCKNSSKKLHVLLRLMLLEWRFALSKVEWQIS